MEKKNEVAKKEELTGINGTTVEKVVKYEVNGKLVQLSMNTIRQFLTKGNGNISDQEIGMFMSICKYQELNPFLGDAILVKYDNTKPAQIVVSKEAFMKRAYAQTTFDGFKAGIIVQREKAVLELEGAFMLSTDKLLGGWAEIHVKDKSIPYVVKVDLEEYNKGQSTWKVMPKTMIRKVAIVQALREAYPTQLGALYVEEEPIFGKSNVVEEVKQDVEERTAKEDLPFPEVEQEDDLDSQAENLFSQTDDEPDFMKEV